MPAVAAPPPPSLDPQGAPRPRVLVCEDSATTRAFIRSLLERDHDLLLTETAEEALDRAVAFAPDVILSDLILPGMSGSALCRAVRAIPALAGVPFVFVTTLAGEDARADGLEAGADDYLVKPIRERELRARVASLVRLRRVLGDLEQRTDELQRANRALEETQDELVRAEKRAAVGALSTGLTHELTNPLAYLKSGAATLDGALAEVRAAVDGLLGQVPAGDPRRGQVGLALSEATAVAEAIGEASRRLERLAAELRIATWPGGPDDERVDPADALEAAWALARPRVPGAPRLACAGDDVDPLRAPRALLVQALAPLLEAAARAAGPDGVVAVETRSVPGGVELRVRDGAAAAAAPVCAPVEPHRGDGPAPLATLRFAAAAAIARRLGGELLVGAGAGGHLYRLRLPRRPGALVTGS